MKKSSSIKKQINIYENVKGEITMKYFLNLSTRAKLFISFGLIWLMFLVVVIIAYQSLHDITTSEKELYNTHFKIALELRQLRSHQNFNRAAVLDMMLTKNKTGQREIEESINKRGNEINEIIQKLSVLNRDLQFQFRMKELANEINLYRKARTEEISLIQNGKIDEAQNLGMTTQKDRFEKIRLISTELGDTAEKEANDQLVLDQQQANSSILLFVIFGVTALFFSIAMILLLNKTIAQPLNDITRTASLIAQGDLDVELSVVERKDEVGVLSQAFNKMIYVLKKMATTAQQIASGDLTGDVIPQSEKDVLGNTFLQMLNNLRRMTKDILDSVNQLASSSSEILAATTQVASGAAETASAIIFLSIKFARPNTSEEFGCAITYPFSSTT